MKRQKNFKILIVCTGNTCRSPMAKVILEQLLKENKLDKKVLVDTAGMISLEGYPASRTAVEVCREYGLDLSAHLSQGITDRLVQDADLIIVMEEMHEVMLVRNDAETPKKIKLLSGFAPDKSIGPDIQDPYGGDKYLYQLAFKDIKLCLEGLIPYLKEQLTML